ncbi:MAG: hypothetical protein RSD68_08355, partial [Oscillospiraceae bacterium]
EKMASTNKTANLGLNQWVLSDPLRMEDFNEDNRKVDAALGAQPYVKLMEATTVAGTKTVELNLSGINIADYLSFRLYRVSNFKSGSMFFRINKITKPYMYLNYDGSLYNDTNYCFFNGGYVDFDLCPSMFYFYNYRKTMTVSSDFNANMIKTIDLFESGDAVFPIGTSFVLMGVKR